MGRRRFSVEGADDQGQGRRRAQHSAAEEVRPGLRRESLSRALSTKGNPTLGTLLAVLSAAGLRLAVARREEHPA